MMIEMSVSEGSLTVYGPRDRIFTPLMNVVGGRWNGEAWIVDRKFEGSVREYLRRISEPRVPPLRVVHEEAPAKAAAPDASQLATLFDPAFSVAEQLSTLSRYSGALEVNTAPAETLEEFAAALEALSSRMRTLAR